MSDAWLLAAAPILGMISNAVVQATLSHLWRRRAPALAIACGAAAGLAIAAGTAAWVSSFPPMQRVCWSAASYLGLAFGYWAFLNLNLTSVRIRLLKELLAAPGGTLSQSDLGRRYDNREMAERRLARLEASNRVVRVDGRYVLKAQGLARLARLIRLVRRAVIPRP